MFSCFLKSFKLKTTYRVNTFIYSVKQLPIIKNLLKNTLYSNKPLKVLGLIFSIILELIDTFLGKFLYVFLIIFSLASIYEGESSNSVFIHIFIFLTIAGSFMNTYMFNPTKDKYYAMFSLRMDAKLYTLTNYYYTILKVIVGFLPFTIIFGLMSHVPLIICLIIPFFVAAAKIIVASYLLKQYEKKDQIIDENHPLKGMWILSGILLALAFALPYFHLTIPLIPSLIFMIITIIFSLTRLSYLNNFNKYKEIYKIILTEGNMNLASYKTNSTNIQKKQIEKQINIKDNVTSNKHGYAYFNDLFVKRHSKILLSSAKKVTVFALIAIIVCIIIIKALPPLALEINNWLLVMLPYFVFIMYLINRGQVVSQAMFMNCDHSMLTYGFYREPKVILNLFRERLKSVIIINLLPATIIGLGLTLILFVSGGTDNILEYPLLFISIIAMSIFFSVHHLVMYYLLQPYNVNSEMKSSTYQVVNFLTYLACYWMIELQIPIFSFGLMTIIFSILYCLISLILIYKLAPKTFKLRV